MDMAGVVRKGTDAAEVEAIVEQKALTAEQAKIREINSGIYAFRTQPLLAHLKDLTTGNNQGEYYLTDLARILVEAGEPVVACRLPMPARCWAPIRFPSW